MGALTGISWTWGTFNICEGCTKVSDGCRFCYAEARDLRFSDGAHWGPGAPRKSMSASYWRRPLQWNKEAQAEGKRRLVFCGSLSDWCDKEAPEGAVEWLFALIRSTPWITWQLLTKRPERIEQLLPADWGDGYWNVWLGTSVEDQANADRRLRHLSRIPAHVRFVSYEPALGPVDFRRWLRRQDAREWKRSHVNPTPGIDWVIVGGESGDPTDARPFDLGWARSVVEQCRQMGAAPFVKQLGVNPISDHQADLYTPLGGFRIVQKKGDDPTEFPADLRVQEFPQAFYVPVHPDPVSVRPTV